MLELFTCLYIFRALVKVSETTNLFRPLGKKWYIRMFNRPFFILARTNHRTPTTRCAFNRCFNGASSTKTVSKSSGQPTSDPTTRVGWFLTSFLTGWWSSNVIWLDGKYSVCVMYHDTYEGNNSKVDSSDSNLVYKLQCSFREQTQLQWWESSICK